MAKDPSKTEAATPKRVSKAREEGNVAKSQEIGNTVTIATGTLALAIYMKTMYLRMATIFENFLGGRYVFNSDPAAVYSLMIQISMELAILIMPIALFVAVCVWIAIRMQVGALWTTKVFEFKWDRFNPINGLKNMVLSPQAFVRLGKTLMQSVIIGYVPFVIIQNEFENFLPLYNATPAGIAEYMMRISLKMVSYSLVPMIIIAAADYLYTKYQYDENLKMSKDEVKDEHKQAEGDPAVKSQMRQKMMAIMARRMLESVPKADVIITNPTHIAVALRYNTMEAPAPVVVAMGVDHMAERIKEIARENNVPIRENVPLARALYKAVEVGDMIPEELYKAVASILAGIWRIKNKMGK